MVACFADALSMLPECKDEFSHRLDQTLDILEAEVCQSSNNDDAISYISTQSSIYIDTDFAYCESDILKDNNIVGDISSYFRPIQKHRRAVDKKPQCPLIKTCAVDDETPEILSSGVSEWQRAAKYKFKKFRSKSSSGLAAKLSHPSGTGIDHTDDSDVASITTVKSVRYKPRILVNVRPSKRTSSTVVGPYPVSCEDTGVTSETSSCTASGMGSSLSGNSWLSRDRKRKIKKLLKLFNSTDDSSKSDKNSTKVVLAQF